MVGDSDVLVAASGADGKPACVVGVEFGERHFCDVELVGRGNAGWFASWFAWRWLGWNGKYGIPI